MAKSFGQDHAEGYGVIVEGLIFQIMYNLIILRYKVLKFNGLIGLCDIRRETFEYSLKCI